MPKIIAMYLPQYHQIEENDKWWGKGFTDWVSVKNSSSLFKNHLQPRVPLNNNYYDLSQVSNIKAQVKLAKEYGIYGFGIYHYWFSSNQRLLTKPAELILENKDIDINFFFAWDNSSWIRTWSKFMLKERYINDWSPKNDMHKVENNDGVLAKLDYGNEEDFKIHFNYLLPFFLDKRYIKIDNCPLFAIWNNNNQKVLEKMIFCFNKLAKENGFNGIKIISRYDPYGKTNYFDYYFNYEPQFSTLTNRNIFFKIVNRLKKRVFKTNKLQIYNYDKIWKKSLKFAKKNHPKMLYGGFVQYDDTPRRGKRGMVIKNSNPDKFQKYLEELYKISLKQKKEFIFLTAFNEWGEGAYLEPDTINKYDYLKAVSNVINKFNN